jgi:multidrug efflux pump subunit AcrB
MQREFPGIYWSFEGEKSEQAETLDSLGYLYVIALIVIYALLAIPFNSYIQPLIVMAAIPFGLIGAVWGHVVMGMDITILSGFGVVALTGVVVNDSLVMVDYVNRKRSIGLSEMESAQQAGFSRFRPILLTSLTTFAGLTPLLLEKSLQAKFLVPMAVSLGFGVIFATVITLILVPAMYLILEDIRTFFYGPEGKL